MRGHARAFLPLAFLERRDDDALGRNGPLRFLTDGKVLYLRFDRRGGRRYRHVATYYGDLRRVVNLDLRHLEAIARHLDEIRFRFIQKRRAILHAETQNVLVVAGLAGRAIFHNLELELMARRRGQGLFGRY